MINIPNHLFRPYDTLVIALSGGVDSMVLADVLLTDSSARQQIVLAHFDHGLRPKSAEQADELVQYFTNRHQAVVSERWEQPINTEAAARTARYNFLARTAFNYPNSAIVTAHHLNDQIETFFMKVMRKSTLKGVSGIDEVGTWHGAGRSVDILRPFLMIEKSTLEAYASKYQLPIFEDETNQKSIYERNWWRNELYPQIEEKYPHASNALGTIMNDLKWTEQYVATHLADELRQVIRWAEDRLTIDRTYYLTLPTSTQHLMWSFLSDQISERLKLTLSRRQTLQIKELLEAIDRPQGELQLPYSWRFVRRYDKAYIEKSETEPTVSIQTNDEVLVQEAGAYRIGQQVIEATQYTLNEEELYRLGRRTVVVPVESLPVVIRHRQNGDRLIFEAPHMHFQRERYRQKVSRYFINQKTPQEARDQAVLVIDAQNEIIGIISYLTSKYKVSTKNKYLIFKVVE